MIDIQSLTEKSARQWFVFSEDRHFGPYAENYLAVLLKRGAIGREAYLWSAGIEDWKPILQIEDFIIYHDFLSEKSNPEILNPEPQRSSVTPAIDFNFSTDLRFAETLAAIHERAQAKSKLESKPKTKFIIAGLIAATVAIIAAAVLTIEPNWKSQVRAHGADENAVSQLALAMKASEPRLALATSSDDPKSPVLFLGSSFQDQRKITLKITGQPDTLVGRLWVAFEADITIQNGLGWTMPIRNQDGSYMPTGRYTVEFSCANCTQQEQQALANKPQFFIGTEGAQYQSALTLYHEKLKQKAADEIVELDEIANTLDDQINEFRLFMQRRLSKPKARAAQWALFRDEWGQMQKQFENFFTVFNPKNMKSEFVLSKVYTRLRAVNSLLVQALAQEAKANGAAGTYEPRETERLLGLAQSLNASTRSHMIEIHRKVESSQPFPTAHDLD